jgi:heme ABC exporter, ATP-binding protein CcmA
MIEVSHIKKKYGKKQILQDISFQVRCGECVAVVGKNGCGKSTLLQIMAGILKADGGNIRYFGQDTRKNKKIFRKYCGYVPQENPLMEELSVKDNLKLWGAGKNASSEKVIQQFQLEEILPVPVEKLSGGMKRRLSIACALLEWPPILLLDEPTTAIDIYYQENVRQWMGEYRKMNGIIVMTTHDEKEILTADRCLVMNDGKMLELDGDDIRMQKIRSYIAAP